jgi:hypothetical protein
LTDRLAASDDKAEVQDFEPAALKPTLPVPDWKVPETPIFLLKWMKSNGAGEGAVAIA